VSSIRTRLQPVLDGRDSGHRSDALHDLFELRFENWTAQRDGTVSGRDVNGARMRDQTTQSRAHALDEHVVDRVGLFNELPEQLCRDTAQSMLYIASRHSPNRLRNAIGVCGGLSQAGAPPGTLARICHVHDRSARTGAGQTDKQLIHTRTPRSTITCASFAAIQHGSWSCES
jgi:hypothetical protein